VGGGKIEKRTTRTLRQCQRCRACGERSPRRHLAWAWTGCRTRTPTSSPTCAALSSSPSPPLPLPPPPPCSPPSLPRSPFLRFSFFFLASPSLQNPSLYCTRPVCVSLFGAVGLLFFGLLWSVFLDVGLTGCAPNKYEWPIVMLCVGLYPSFI
jgi:hypothetical protein